jgi:NAD(P)-dependent dehydrogenase (short-subunit alcohol dehydrogenase family)
MRFDNKVVFITGGTRGLGKAMAEAFLAEGARVAVCGRNNDSVARFEEEHRSERVKAFAADITDYQGMEGVANSVADGWGRVDVLINSAGIVNPLAPSERTKKDDFDKTIDVNVKGAFYAAQIFGRKMIEQGSGRIIFISSQVAQFGDKGFLPYAVSKSALFVMTRNLSSEWSRFGVTLCCLAPGFIAGGMNEGLIKRQQFVDFLSAKTPIGRMGRVDEMIATILFLASPEAQYINGETIVMDGGMTGYDPEGLLDMIAKPPRKEV